MILYINLYIYFLINYIDKKTFNLYIYIFNNNNNINNNKVLAVALYVVFLISVKYVEVII